MRNATNKHKHEEPDELAAKDAELLSDIYDDDEDCDTPSDDNVHFPGGEIFRLDERI